MVMVSTSGAEVALSFVAGKTTLAGEKVIDTGPGAAPLRGTLWGAPMALSFMTRLALALPTAVGWKAM